MMSIDDWKKAFKKDNPRLSDEQVEEAAQLVMLGAGIHVDYSVDPPVVGTLKIRKMLK